MQPDTEHVWEVPVPDELMGALMSGRILRNVPIRCKVCGVEQTAINVSKDPESAEKTVDMLLGSRAIEGTCRYPDPDQRPLADEAECMCDFCQCFFPGRTVAQCQEWLAGLSPEALKAWAEEI